MTRTLTTLAMLAMLSACGAEAPPAAGAAAPPAVAPAMSTKGP